MQDGNNKVIINQFPTSPTVSRDDSRFTLCCGRLDISTAARVIGILWLIFFVTIHLFLAIAAGVNSPAISIDTTFRYICLITAIIFLVLVIPIAVSLFFGVCTSSRRMLIPYLIFQVVHIVLLLILAIALTVVTAISHQPSFERVGCNTPELLRACRMGGTVTSIVLFIYMVLQMFFTWIIFTYHRFLSECDNSAPVQSVQFKSSHSINSVSASITAVGTPRACSTPIFAYPNAEESRMPQPDVLNDNRTSMRFEPSTDFKNIRLG